MDKRDRTLAEQMEQLDAAVADLGKALVESPLGQCFVRFHAWENARIGEPLATIATWFLLVVFLTWPPLLIEAWMNYVQGK